MNKRIVSFFFLLLFAGSLYAAIGITDLRTEQLKNPAGIDVRQPRLSWRIESDEQNVIQTAYHILVASSRSYWNKEKEIFGIQERLNLTLLNGSLIREKH